MRRGVASARRSRGDERGGGWRCFFTPFLNQPPGYLVSTDAYMNLQVRSVSEALDRERGRLILSPNSPFFSSAPSSQLASTEEFVDGKMTGQLGEVLVRCNNVLYIRAAPDDEGGA